MWFTNTGNSSIGRITAANTPDAPVTPLATAGNASMTVTWDPPGDDGDGPITSYTATASPDGATCTWTSGPLECTIEGLSNGVAYSATVTATNGAGTSAASPPTNEVTPSACLGTTGAGPFTDVAPTHLFCNHIEQLTWQNIINGYTDGTYRPNNAVTRAAVAAFLYRQAGSPEFTPPDTPTFNDVPATHLFHTEIEWVAAQGITTGYTDSTYRPNNPVTRAAVAALLHRFAHI